MLLKKRKYLNILPTMHKFLLMIMTKKILIFLAVGFENGDSNESNFK